MDYRQREIRNIIFSHDMTYAYPFQKYLDIEKLYRGKDETIKLDFTNADANILVKFDENHLELELLYQGKHVVSAGYGQTIKDSQISCENFWAELDKRKLTMSPPATAQFVEEIKRLTPASLLALSTKKCFVCDSKEDNFVTLRTVFSGDLNNIRPESFKISETIKIDVNNLNDIQWLYGLAYDFDKHNVEIRNILNAEHGKHKTTDIESSLTDGQTAAINVGPVTFYCIKEDGKTIWRDFDMRPISREDVSVIFAWAHNSVAGFSTGIFGIDENGPYHYFKKIKDVDLEHLIDCAYNVDARAFISEAFALSQEYDGVSINISGLEDAGLYGYESATYVFVIDENKQKHIYRITYDGNDFSQDPTLIKEIHDSEFEQFLRQKYSRFCLLIKDKYQEQGIEYPQEQESVILQATIEKMRKAKTSNPLDISKDEIDAIENGVQRLVENYIEKRDETLTFTDFFRPPDDIGDSR